MSGNENKSKKSSDSQDIQIARLAFIGASIVTLGDGIAAIAAGLALEALESKQGSQNLDEQSKQSDTMQKQIDYIIDELIQIKMMMEQK